MRKSGVPLMTMMLAGMTFLSACGGGGSGGGSGSSSTGSESATIAAGAELGAIGPDGAILKGRRVPPAPVSTVPGISYPFASHLTAYVAGIAPSVTTQATQDTLIRTRYDGWKARGVKAGCGGYVVTYDANYMTVSEGVGYGMLLTVVMAGYDSQARTLFDGILKVARNNPAYNTGQPALMDWRVKADCTSGGGGWNAMDGDLDIAMALLMADKQWGSAGTVNYKAEALATIAALKVQSMSPDGRTKGQANGENSRTSDYMIAHFKAFRRATGDAFWDLATDKAFSLLDAMQSGYSPATGLIPDFIINGSSASPSPSPGYVVEGNGNEGFYYWNACRLPLRLATDYVTSGDARSKAVTSKMMDFFNNTSGGNPALIQSGYKLDGTGLSTYAAPAFIGPATAGAMVDARFQPFLNSLWTYSGANPANSYYESELQLLSQMVASGNWWNP